MPVPSQVFRCERCASEVVFDPELFPSLCGFCGAKGLTHLTQPAPEPPPQFYVPFTLDGETARRRFLDWLGSGLWYPREVVRQVQDGEFVGLYVPTYQFTCHVRTEVEEPRTEGSSSQGSRGEKTPGAHPSFLSEEGTRSGYYNERISSSRGLAQEDVQQLLPYNYRLMRPFADDAMREVKRERVGFDEDHCWEVALKNIRRAERLAFRGSGGERARLTVDCLERKSHLILIPVWMLGYGYQGRYFRALMNGQTGKVSEIRQLVPSKVTLVAASVGVTLLCGMVFLLSADSGEPGGDLPRATTPDANPLPVHLRVRPNMTFAGYRQLDLSPGNVTEQLVKRSFAAGDTDISESLQQARDMAEKGNRAQAEDLLRRLSQEASQDPGRKSDAARLRLELAAILLGGDKLEQAVEEAGAVLQASPKNARAFQVLGEAQLRLGRFAEAAAAFRGAYDEEASNAFLVLTAGHLFRLLLQDVEKARQCYRDFLKEPEAAPGAKFVGLLLAELEGKTDPYLADVVTLRSGEELRGEVLSRDQGLLRLRVRSGSWSKEVEHPLAEVAREEKGEGEFKLEMDRVLRLHDEAFVKGKGLVPTADYLALARACLAHEADSVRANASFFAELALLADPKDKEATALLENQGYMLVHNRLLRRRGPDAR
ncbi:MAG: hypothetical protein HYZ53_27760 [Planctomycetes bacterium]|nr:hypothetical protein [Planctomycetota bacterium]